MAANKQLALARDVHVDESDVHILMTDGREIAIPFQRYRFLRDAGQTERADCIVDEGGTVIFWPRLREGISVAGLIGVTEEELVLFAEGARTR